MNRYDPYTDKFNKFIKDVPDTNVGETIYKQAALDAIRDVFLDDGVVTDKELMRCIKGLPAAQPDLIECDPVLACSEATADKVVSTYSYLSVVRELEKCGYVLAMRRREG